MKLDDLKKKAQAKLLAAKHVVKTKLAPALQSTLKRLRFEEKETPAVQKKESWADIRALAEGVMKDDLSRKLPDELETLWLKLKSLDQHANDVSFLLRAASISGFAVIGTLAGVAAGLFWPLVLPVVVVAGVFSGEVLVSKANKKNRASIPEAMDKLVVEFNKQGDEQKELDLFQKKLDLIEKKFGKDVVGVATALHQLFNDKGQLPPASTPAPAVQSADGKPSAPMSPPPAP